MNRTGNKPLADLIDCNHARGAAEMYFSAALWMRRNAQLLEGERPQDAIRSRFGVSRATAYRWLAAYRAASGVA